VLIEKSLRRGVGLRFVASCPQKPDQGVQYALIIIDDKYRKVGNAIPPSPNTGQKSASPRVTGRVIGLIPTMLYAWPQQFLAKRRCSNE